jgi:hypothetical protein
MKTSAQWSHDLYVDAPPPIAAMFYMLQCIAPGMFLIVRIDEINDYGEQEIIRSLPRTVWIEENKDMLLHVLGSEERLSAIVEASKEVTVKNNPYLRDYYNDSDRESAKDFTACDKECGYCGRCDY